MVVWLAVAAYNEEQGLPHVLERFRRQAEAAGYRGRVIVVDDGSTDGTCQAAERWGALPVELIRHPVNRGLGESIQDALSAGARLAAPGDVIITMDADNTHPPELIPAMLERLEAGCEVVVASRYRRGSRVVGLGRLRHLLCYGSRFLYQAVFPTPGLRDYTCAFRGYRAETVQALFQRYGPRPVREPGFTSMAEILLRLRRMGVRMCEVPMVLRYDQKGGASKMRVAATVVRTLRLLARERCAGWFGRTGG